MKVKVFAVTLCLALLLGVPLTSSVQAAVGMTPSEGAVGSEVTISDLTSSQAYVIKWDGVSYKTGTVPPSGQVTFIVPETPAGAYTVEVENPSPTLVMSLPFTVTPSITLDPNSGTGGTTVTVEGTGFEAAETGISVTYGGTSVKTGITANDDGSWDTTFDVPDSAKGSHIVDASGDTTEADDVADKTFTISPGITINPTSGAVGIEVKVEGTGFASAESNIKVTYGGKDVKTGITAGDDGSWDITFKIPSSTRGDHQVDASGGTTTAGDVTDVIFTVSPGVTVDPDSAYVDDEVDVTGSGFANDETGIKVTLDGEVVADGIEANDQGYWKTSIIIPASVNGGHTIDAYGGTTPAADVSDVTLTVLARIVLTPKTGSVGENIKVKCTGFSSKEDIAITYADDSVVTDRTTDTAGSLSTSFEAPAGSSGEVVVIATDAEDVTASATFTMEATPPDVPQIASPKDGGRAGFIGDARVKFDWTDVSDPSGVHYALEVSAQSNFAITLLSHIDLTNSEYTLTEAEALPHGEYYWRVRAIDEAGNASDWTESSVVKVGVMTVKTFIIIVASIVAFIIVVTVLPKVLRKKPKKWSFD